MSRVRVTEVTACRKAPCSGEGNELTQIDSVSFSNDTA